MLISRGVLSPIISLYFDHPSHSRGALEGMIKEQGIFGSSTHLLRSSAPQLAVAGEHVAVAGEQVAVAGA